MDWLTDHLDMTLVVDWHVKPHNKQIIACHLSRHMAKSDLCGQQRLSSAWASAQSDQITVFTVRMKKHWALNYLLTAQ